MPEYVFTVLGIWEILISLFLRNLHYFSHQQLILFYAFYNTERACSILIKVIRLNVTA